MKHTKATARRWATYYKTHSLRATADHFGVSHETVSVVLKHYRFKLRDKSEPSAAVVARRQQARAAKLRAMADAVAEWGT